VCYTDTAYNKSAGHGSAGRRICESAQRLILAVSGRHIIEGLQGAKALLQLENMYRNRIKYREIYKGKNLW
jgi:hypothetical protein